MNDGQAVVTRLFMEHVAIEEERKGYADQMRWLQGRSIAEAEQALEARQATLADIAYNRGGNAATTDYIEQMRRFSGLQKQEYQTDAR